MAEPAQHVLVAPIDALIAAWGAMGRGAGYRRDYRGAKRIAFDLPEEEDDEIPWVQVDLGDDEPATPERSDNMHQLQEVLVQVHVMADTMPDGTKDIVTPLLEVTADLHQAAFADRTLGTSYAHLEQPTRREVSPFGIGLDAVGATLRVTYQIQYWHTADDMSATPF
jgi:hypothetical protein